MVTNGVRELVSSSAQVAIAPQAAAAAANTPARPASQAEAQPAPAKDTSNEVQIPLESVVKHLNSYLENSGRSLSFSIDQDSGRTVVKVYNSGTDELIRQFPAEQVLKLAEVFDEGEVSGLLFNTEA